MGLIDNCQGEGREKHYYPTEHAESIYLEKNDQEIKRIILDSILDVVKRKMETLPQEKHANFLLWYLLKLRQIGVKPDEAYFDKGGEMNDYPRIRLNFSLSLCDFLFGENKREEEGILQKWDKYLSNGHSDK